jgi:hypothetical protein
VPRARSTTNYRHVNLVGSMASHRSLAKVCSIIEQNLILNWAKPLAEVALTFAPDASTAVAMDVAPAPPTESWLNSERSFHQKLLMSP